MKIDLSCPAEVWQCLKPRQDYAACDLTLYNLSGKNVNSVEVTLTQYDASGHELEHVIHRGHSLHGRQGSTFPMTVPCAYYAQVKRIEAIIEKVWFDDNDVWRRGKAALTEYIPNELPKCRDLDNLQYVAGANAKGWPAEQEAVWVCVCGRPNEKDTEVCARCRRRKQDIFTRFSREAVENQVSQREHRAELQSRAVREDMARMQLLREEEFNRKKARARRTRALLVSMAGMLALSALVWFLGVPGFRYLSGLKSMKTENWYEATEVFDSLKSFLRSEEYLAQSRWALAVQQLDAGENLASAAEVFRAAGTPEGENLARRADYARAKALLEAGETRDAAALFRTLADYEDSENCLKECAYRDALVLLSEKKYAEAEKAFRELGDYPGAAEGAADAVYEAALQQIENGDYTRAIAALNELGPWRDSGEQVSRAWYLKAEALEAEGDMMAAGDAFIAAGNWKDAPERGAACTYQPACAAMEAGDFETAMLLFEKIPDYLDARYQYNTCAWNLAEEAMKNQEYTRAGELYAVLPDDFENVVERRQEAVYRPGVAAVKKKDWETAVRLLESVPGYNDADSQLVKARYGYADSLMEKENYAEAAAQFEQLGTYSDAEKKCREASLRAAEVLLADGEFEKAEKLLSPLEGNADVTEKLREARLGIAQQQLAEGKIEEARAVFILLNAPEQIQACDYALADRLEQAGETEKAADLFASVRDYLDAADRAGALYTRLGEDAVSYGQVLNGAAYYAKAGAYEDAAEKSRALYDRYYGEACATIQKAMADKDYALAVTLMENMVMTDLPEAYADLPELYQEANYLAGNQLFNAKRPYEALPYYRAIPDYKDVAERLENPAYLLLGTWRKGDDLLIFRDDGVCWLNGEKLYFNVTNPYQVMTSPTPDGTYANTHRVHDVTRTMLSLSDMREGLRKNYRLTRVEDEEFPSETEEASVTEAGFVVEEDEE